MYRVKMVGPGTEPCEAPLLTLLYEGETLWI